MSNDIARFARELSAQPDLAEEVLLRWGELLEEPGVVIVKASEEQVDEAICRALALVCQGIPARVELTNGEN
jgi:hypothetical protein